MSTSATPLILRDGTTARVRPSQPEDAEAMAAFIKRASEQQGGAMPLLSRPYATLTLEELLDSSDPARRLTLLAIRSVGGEQRVVGAAGYRVIEPGQADIALGVDEAFRGKGLATRLVERLAMAAAGQDLCRLTAHGGEGSEALLDVLRRSGFSLGERRAEDESVLVDLAVLPDPEARQRSELRDRLATRASLRPFFHPRAVAVIGASRDEESLGYRTLHGLVVNRFQGPVYAVNPKADSIGAIPCYPSVKNLPGPVDLAIVLVPKQYVAAVADECAAAGVRALVVITAGFAETGQEGRERQDELLAKVRAHGMRMVGPNCMGLLNADRDVRLAATFAPVFPPAGNVGMSSQSGALGLAILATADDLGIGLSTFVSVGNKADVSSNDLLQYWEEDDHTDVILLYVESFGNPRRFARIARRVARKKPIVAVKSGRTGAGKVAAGSHTAALAESDVAVDALFRQTGVLRAETLEEMFDMALLLSSQPLPSGRRVAILTNAGGPAILCADACEGQGLEIAELSAPVREALAAFLPEEASTRNPVDMIAGAGADDYRQAADILIRAEEVDALIVIYAPIDAAQVGPVEDALHEVLADVPPTKPIITCLMGEGGRGQSRGMRRGIPSYVFPEDAARVLGRATEYAAWRREPQGQIPELAGCDASHARPLCRRILAERGATWLQPDEVREVLGLCNLPLVPESSASTADEAVAAAEELGFPVVMKLVARDIVHKTDVGGVQLDLRDADAVQAAFYSMRGRLEDAGQGDRFEGVIVQPFVTGGVEVIVGATEDPVFGSLVAFGLGGIHVEVLGDVVFRVAPITDKDAVEMVGSIRGRKLLEGYRGHAAADEEAIRDVLLRISRLVDEVPEIDDLDINPMLAMAPGEGCRILDARIHLSEPTVEES
ncbi:MAG: GNAT family N-acetyltransferase [Planctomycetota bacterium]|nr:GNAT family N-acetyltransferase [Planctomycetota bacterium]